MLLAWPKKPLVLTYAIQTCVIEQPPSKWVSAAKAAVEEDEERGKAEELRSERESRDRKYHLMCLLCDSRVYVSLQTSSTVVTATPPNHSLGDITGSGSLANPSPIHPRQPQALERRRAQPKPHLYLALVFIALVNRLSKASTPRSRSPLQFLQTRNSSKEMSGQGYESGTLIRFYSLQDKVTPATSSAAEPSLPFPERKLGADAGERETPSPPPAAFSSRCYKATRKLSFPSSESLKELRKWIFHPAALAYSRIKQSMKDGRWVARSSMLSWVMQSRADRDQLAGSARRVNSISQQRSTTSYRSTVKNPLNLMRAPGTLPYLIHFIYPPSHMLTL
ncbi:hypothetical protein BKA70DRAFT_1223528 [Coprinopsis sp. MPI-PUGE-AT-0042]|nr:hypothetical protein BKA70DRAFT_1223528 [Coprinopsis sp. MPI-PUGE-AT-0042]